MKKAKEIVSELKNLINFVDDLNTNEIEGIQDLFPEQYNADIIKIGYGDKISDSAYEKILESVVGVKGKIIPIDLNTGREYIFYKDLLIQGAKYDVLRVKTDISDFWLTEESAVGIISRLQESEIEKTPFNDAELFVKEYKDYLIGKKIKLQNEAIETISKIYVASPTGDYPVDSVIFQYPEHNNIGEFYILPENFQRFIDGESFDEENLQIELILQETPKLNNPENKYYIVTTDDKIKIVAGFEYSEDANAELQRISGFGNGKLTVVSKKDLLSANVNPDETTSWQISLRDWEIIKQVLNSGVERGDYSQSKADGYLEFYKQGKYASVIKAQLIYSLHEHQKKLKMGFVTSNLERINEEMKITTRIEKELLNILKEE